MSRVTPIRIGQLILEPIKYFFKNYAPAAHLSWDPDPKKSKIDISLVNDANKENIDHDMQILVDRGTIQVSKTGLSDNMAIQETAELTKGLNQRTNFLIYSGQAQIIIKARTEGNAEILADIVMHVLQWSRPHICDTLGFKDFALPMTISNTELTKTDVEVFQISISVPYVLEELWESSNDALKLRQFFLSLRTD